MKSLVFIFSGLLIATTALAQHGGGGHSGGGHSGGGHWGGGGGHWGGGGGFHGGSVGSHGGFGRGYYGGYIVGGYIPTLGYGYGAPPSYDSGYNDSGNGYVAPAPPPPDQSMGYGPGDYGPGGGQPAPPPPEDNGPRMYQAPAPSPQEQAMAEGRYYLIAYKDHSVYTALAYWMENGALNYVTPQNAHNQVSLNLVDIDLTRQLNARRGYAFNIVNQ